eukprot:7788051-Pyramimonas_sp.AAC.2
MRRLCLLLCGSDRTTTARSPPTTLRVANGWSNSHGDGRKKALCQCEETFASNTQGKVVEARQCGRDRQQVEASQTKPSTLYAPPRPGHTHLALNFASCTPAS